MNQQKPKTKQAIHVFGLILLLAILGFLISIRPQPKAPAVVDLSAKVSGHSISTVPLTNLTSALAGFKDQARSLTVPVLMYHHVGPLIEHDPTAVDLTVSPEDFTAQVEYFKNLGYHSVTVQQVYDALQYGASLPSKPIVFTFDDGYKDVFEYAIPVLQDHGYVGSFAIATQLLGR